MAARHTVQDFSVCWCSVQRVYINPDAVDDALVDLIHTPSGQLCDSFDQCTPCGHHVSALQEHSTLKAFGYHYLAAKLHLWRSGAMRPFWYRENGKVRSTSLWCPQRQRVLWRHSCLSYLARPARDLKPFLIE